MQNVYSCFHWLLHPPLPLGTIPKRPYLIHLLAGVGVRIVVGAENVLAASVESVARVLPPRQARAAIAAVDAEGTAGDVTALVGVASAWAVASEAP